MQRLDVQEKTHRTSLKELEQICQAHEITIAKMHIEKEHFRETIQTNKTTMMSIVIFVLFSGKGTQNKSHYKVPIP